MVEAELLVVAAETGERKVDADDAGFLGAGEQPRIGAAGAADRDRLRILQIVGLVGPDGIDEVGREARLQLCAGVGQQRRRPVFVGHAEPAVGDVEGYGLGVLDFLVAVFLQAVGAEIADQAFMQDVVAGNLRGVVARDQRERIQRDRCGADIADVILDGEEITVVDRNGAAEGQAFAIVVFQDHRVARRQCAGTFLLPQRVLVGDSRRRARCRNPAELRIIGACGVRRRIQHDRRRGGIDGVAEFHQRQIVDAGALQRDAADQARRVDLDARGGGNRGVAADDGGGLGRLRWWRGSPASSRPAGLCCRAWRPGLPAASAWPVPPGSGSARAAFPSAARCRNIARRSARSRTE